MSGLEEFRQHYAGSRIAAEPVTDEAFLSSYRDRLPTTLIAEWQISGFSGFANGFIWLTNPDEMEYAVAEWDLDLRSLIFGRTAFGDLFLWDGESVRCLFVHDNAVEWLTDDLKMFFEYSLCDDAFLEEVLRFSMFQQGVEMLGPVTSGEMYTFVPALVLGGESDAAHLQKVKMREQLLILSQLHRASG